MNGCMRGVTLSVCSAAAEKAAQKQAAEKAEGEEKHDEGGFMMLKGPKGQPSYTITLDKGAGRMKITQLPAEDPVVIKVFTSRTTYYLALAPASRFDDKWQLLEKEKMLLILVDEAVLATWEKETVNGPRPSDYVEGKGPLIKYLVSFDVCFMPTTTVCTDICTAC